MLYNREFISYFTEYTDYFFTYRPYNRYTNILEYYRNDCLLVESISEYIMNVYKNDSMEVCLTDNQYMPLISVPRQHIYYIIRNVILKPIQTVGFSFKFIEEMDINDNTLTKPLYMLLLKVLQARIIKYAVDSVIDDIRTYDHQSLKDDIALFIHHRVFDENDLRFEHMLDYTYIPQLFSIYECCTLHLFDESHPIITNGKIHTDINLSGCFTDKSVSELHSDLLMAFNRLHSNEFHITIIIKDENDYEYIKLLTNDTIKVSIDMIYHKEQDFKDACIEHFVNKSPNKFIKDIIYLHDIEYGLVNDVYEYPPHPPESFEEIPERVTPFLIDIMKST